MSIKFKEILIIVIFFFQKILFYISKCLTFWIPTKNSGRKLIIGRETAGLLNLYSNIFDCYSINTEKSNAAYSVNYSLDLSSYPKVVKYIFLPILFPLILKRFSGIWFFSSASFFLSNDGREWEFKQAKLNHIQIVCFFVGSDIRSLKLTKQLSLDLNLDHWSYYFEDTAVINNSDVRSKLFSNASNLYADYIFSCQKDQASYINRSFLPPMPVSKNNYYLDHKKWNDLSTIRILHSPSWLLYKGTTHVMAAIKKLELENYKFEFKLLTGVDNNEIQEELDRTHIALNEFYTYVPGIFGIEAMEANCLLLTSASKKLEPTLFDGCDEAWVPTMYYEIYENLKFYLDNIEEAKNRANSGTLWAKRFCSHEASKDYIDAIIK